MTNVKMQERLYEAANYADAIQQLADAYDDFSYRLLAAKCSEIICEVADSMTTQEGESK